MTDDRRVKSLEEAGRPEVVFPYAFYKPEMQAMIRGGMPLRAEPRWFRGVE